MRLSTESTSATSDTTRGFWRVRSEIERALLCKSSPSAGCAGTAALGYPKGRARSILEDAAASVDALSGIPIDVLLLRPRCESTHPEVRGKPAGGLGPAWDSASPSAWGLRPTSTTYADRKSTRL